MNIQYFFYVDILKCTSFNGVEIDSLFYDIETVYDLKNSIVIIGHGDFKGKTIKFVLKT